MNKKLVIFGSGDMAELAYFYFSKQSEYEVAAFALDSEYIDAPELCGLPVVPTDLLASTYPPFQYDMFVALGYSKVNRLRRDKFEQLKELGYHLASFISPNATVLSASPIGENCFIFEDNTIQPFVEIGSNVTLWSGNHIGHHTTIDDHCFITSHVVVSGRVKIGKQCFFGVNATIRDHISIGNRCVIGAGSLILEDAEDDQLYIGTKTLPAEISSSKLTKI